MLGGWGGGGRHARLAWVPWRHAAGPDRRMARCHRVFARSYICSDTPGRQQLLRWLVGDLRELLDQLPGSAGFARLPNPGADTIDANGGPGIRVAAPWRPKSASDCDCAEHEVLQAPASPEQPGPGSREGPAAAAEEALAATAEALRPPSVIVAACPPGVSSGPSMQQLAQVPRTAQEQAACHASTTPASAWWCC